MRSGAKALADSLEKSGAEVVFGYPGGMPRYLEEIDPGLSAYVEESGCFDTVISAAKHIGR